MIHKDKAKAIEFIQEHKYNPRFEVVMRCFVEQLASSQRVSLDELMSIIDGGLKDVTEWNHSLCKLWIIDG